MKTSEIRELNLIDLKDRIEAEKEAYLQLKINHAVSPADNTSKLREARKDIARMMTILRQREINDQK